MNKLLLLPIVLLCLCAQTTLGNVPDPSCCEVHPADDLWGAVLCPDLPNPHPATVNIITVRNQDCAPYPNLPVEVIFTLGNQICPGAVLTGVTDENGEVEIVFAGSGCVHDTPTGCVIRAAGLTIREYRHAKSPDFDGSGGDGVVNLADLVGFSNEFLDNAPNECYDFNNDGNTGLDDLLIFGSAFMGQLHCP